ncbi:putative enoyl-CoA hydratase, mitochondrial, variant 2 [Dermatophagoides farinae]|uniref:Enoyl-CoA hydratase, mitochondrial, variant 2 n=1 Tax=Dermatophagoides farinae TaxID=6954 RepID=A0A922LCC5_DERFA|nr:putative enoyl-CoA hydratase, mitochondrial, variant 2 [Dermatophagoides farinae]
MIEIRLGWILGNMRNFFSQFRCSRSRLNTRNIALMEYSFSCEPENCQTPNKPSRSWRECWFIFSGLIKDSRITMNDDNR